MEKTLLEPGCYYHIYNRGNNGQDLFFEPENYTFFLQRYDQYISPFCDTIAWVLLRNHFHLLVYVKSRGEIDLGKLEYTATEVPKRIDVHLQFGHFFNSYAKAINKRYNRTGSLFEKNFERKAVKDVSYFKQLILYIHHNPVKHHFCDDIADYPWSSYGSVISHCATKLNRDFVLELYNGLEEFKLYHQQTPDDGLILDLIIE
jgi:REP element-mobilizing transposase RayT